ncbi:flagellar basal body-associated FliL family protein [Paracandidimonas soli]|uniref:Flagellar protein FliL n=1 Tax=Paracandidimonas soli TaxID=1917182 RepID=A0A4R3VAM4_9BURK|nr:flagellar basal body-associated FliL family protein [Paracandidimonas soli]TCV00823.1 flagellar FliL protein [Paracandidimonas soli]
MAKSESRSFSKILKSMLVVLLIVAASIGATLYYTTQTGAQPLNAGNDGVSVASAQAAVTPPPPPPIFVSLEPFTVTLRNERASRILHVAITLRVTDEASRQVLTTYMPEVRDRVLSRLAEQHPVQVQTTEGRAKLVQDLSNALEAPYLPQPQGPSIQNVLFTAFVVQ